MGRVADEKVKGCPHVFEEVRARKGDPLYGWHCPRCGQKRPRLKCRQCGKHYGEAITPRQASRFAFLCSDQCRNLYQSAHPMEKI